MQNMLLSWSYETTYVSPWHSLYSAFTMNIQKCATDVRDDECSKQRDKQQQTNDSSYGVPIVMFLSTAVVTGCWGGWRLYVIKLSCLWDKYLTGHIIFAITPTWFYSLCFYCSSDISKYTHSSTYAIAMFQKIQHKSNFAHMVNYKYIYRAVQCKSHFQHAGTCSVIPWLPCCLCHCPAVVFCHFISLYCHSHIEKLAHI
jgi:hypothetical protein